MSKPRSRPRASNARPTRRSLVELTAAASSAMHDGLLAVPPDLIATSSDAVPAIERAAETFDGTTGSILIDRPAAGEATAKIPASKPAPAHAVASHAGKSENPDPIDTTTEMAVRIAKDYQAGVLEDMKATMNAALDYAKDLANTRGPIDATSGALAHEDKGRSFAGPEHNIRTALGVAAECRAEAFEQMKVNMNATLEYAQQLAHVRTTAEFVELSSTHARKHCELILRQARELRSLTQTVIKSGTQGS
jgi:hypothetical protein